MSQAAGQPASAVRWDLVRRVRREIARGEYETPGKLAAAVARFLEVERGS